MENNYTIKTIRYKMLPNKTQTKTLNEWIRLGKELYNLSLEQYKESYDLNRRLYIESLSEKEKQDFQNKENGQEIITSLKRRHQELQGLPCDILTYVSGFSSIREIESFKAKTIEERVLDIHKKSENILSKIRTLEVEYKNKPNKSNLSKLESLKRQLISLEEKEKNQNNKIKEKEKLKDVEYISEEIKRLESSISINSTKNDKKQLKFYQNVLKKIQNPPENPEKIRYDQFHPSAFGQSNLVTIFKNRYTEFRTIPPATIVPLLKTTERSYKDFQSNMFDYFKKIKEHPETKRPKIKFISAKDPFTFTYEHGDGFRIEQFGKKARIFGFPRIEEGIKVIYHKPILGEVRQQAITKDDDGFYLCITYRHNLLHYPNTNKKVGIDLGVKRNIQLSDGSYKNLPKERMENLQKRKKFLQKRLKRKVSGNRKMGIKQSNSYKKAYARIAKIDKKIAAIRKYYSAMFATEIVRDNDLIAVENLEVKNMTKSAKGTVDSPGKNVRQKSGLNRSILNVAPYMFKLNLKNKAKEYGRTYIEVDPKYTSQKCSKCGTIDKNNRKDQEHFVCVSCGNKMNADHNAAINILNSATNNE